MEQLAKKMKMSVTTTSDLSCNLEQRCKNKCDRYNKQEGSLHLEDGYNSDKCKNKGFVAIPIKTDFGYWTEAMKPCECQTARRNLAHLKNSGLENIVKKYTFANYKIDQAWQSNIKNKALSFIKKENGGWFFIGGSSGAGKTHICTAICSHYLDQGQEVRYMMWREDIERLKANKMDAEVYAEMMDKFKNVPVLYIDDLFKTGKADTLQKPTPADINTAFELLNYRYNKPDLITIISSESQIADLINIDEAIAGRIKERCGDYLINIKPDKTKNYRLRNT